MGLIRYSCSHISGHHEPIHVKLGVWGFFIMFYWNIVMKMLKCKKENLMMSHFSTLLWHSAKNIELTICFQRYVKNWLFKEIRVFVYFSLNLSYELHSVMYSWDCFLSYFLNHNCKTCVQVKQICKLFCTCVSWPDLCPGSQWLIMHRQGDICCIHVKNISTWLNSFLIWRLWAPTLVLCLWASFIPNCFT